LISEPFRYVVLTSRLPAQAARRTQLLPKFANIEDIESPFRRRANNV
jgi:hypothetical protein